MNTGNKLDNLLQKTQTQILASVGRKEEDKHTVFPKGSLLTSEWRETVFVQLACTLHLPHTKV